VSHDLQLGLVRVISLPIKSFFSDFNEIWYVDRGQLLMHDRMPCDPIQVEGQGHGLLNFRKLHFSTSISSAIYNGSWQVISDS